MRLSILIFPYLKFDECHTIKCLQKKSQQSCFFYQKNSQSNLNFGKISSYKTRKKCSTKKTVQKHPTAKMQLKFLGNKCSIPESIFSFLIKFMLSHDDAFQVACNLCPFGYCYRYFIGCYAAFQIVSSHWRQELEIC